MNKLQLIILLIFTTLTVKSQYLAPPIVSHQSGFYTDSFYLNLRHNDPNVRILYTLDGSEPKIENLTGKPWNYKKVYPTNPGDAFGDLLQDTIWTYEYTGPILIKDRSNEPDRIADIATSYYCNENYVNRLDSLDLSPFFKINCVRVVSYLGQNKSYERVCNYFINNSQSSLPISVLNISPEKIFSYESGIYVPGIKFDQYRQIDSITPINPWFPSNFVGDDSIGRINASFSYYDNNEEKLNQLVEIDLHGAGSRYLFNKSFKLYAKGELGVSSFNYPFFNTNNVYKRIILRNSGQDANRTMFQDALNQKLVKNLNIDFQEYKPTILYVNSEYFGLFNLRERYDDYYFKLKYNIDEIDHYDFIQGVKSGDEIHYNETINYALNNDVSLNNNYEHLIKLIDPINCGDYFISQIFINNRDWPINNYEMWRKRVLFNNFNEKHHDGRWRWLIKDTDDSFGFSWPDGGVGVNDLNRITLPQGDSIHNKSTLLFRKLLDNESYKDYFILRFQDLLNSTFQPDFIINRIIESKDLISNEMNEFIRRWNPLSIDNNAFIVRSSNKWNENIDKMKNFALNRSSNVYNHLRERFDLNEMNTVIVGISDTLEGSVKINSLTINSELDGVDLSNPYPWSGQYFEDLPITLSAIPKPGYKFSHWSGEREDSISTITLNLTRDTYVKANFVAVNDSTLNVNSGSKQMDEVLIYPNPAKNQLSVMLDNYDNTSFSIFSIDGRLILKGDLENFKIDISQLHVGRYILTIDNQQSRFTKQFIKE